MTRFEQIGVDRQYYSKNITEAKKLFKSTCKHCATTGKHFECERCKISYAHEIMTDYFKSKNNNTKLN